LATTWSTPSGDPLNGGGNLRDDEAIERQRSRWRLAATNENVRGVTAPEDLHMLPQDLDFLPQEVNAASITDWEVVADPD
jgi:hypothetical protein